MEVQGVDFGVGILPAEIGRLIFIHASTDLDSLALVSKNWVALAEDKNYLEMLRLKYPQIYGVEDWKKYVKVIKISDEIPIPREAYRIIEEGARLTFVPEQVTVMKPNGEEEVVQLNIIKKIERLFQSPITDFHSENVSLLCPEQRGAVRCLQRSHWVCLKTQPIGMGEDFEEQSKLVEEEDKKAYGDYSDEHEDSKSSAHPTENISLATENFGKEARKNRRQIIQVSELIDTLVDAFMVCAKSGNKIKLYNWSAGEMVRVGNATDKTILWIGYVQYGYVVNPQPPSNDCAGVICARKSFGPSSTANWKWPLQFVYASCGKVMQFAGAYLKKM